MSNSLSIRREKLVEGVLQGKSPAAAARDAGYSESYARVDVYRTLALPNIQQRIQARIEDAQLDADEVIGTLVSHMRADLADVLPENEILQRAKQAGLSHVIRKIRVRERVIAQGPNREPIRESVTELELHDSQVAAKLLANILKIEKLPEPIDPTDLATTLLNVLSVAAEQRREHLPVPESQTSDH